MKAKKWLRIMTDYGRKRTFVVDENERGTAASLVGLGYLDGSVNRFSVTNRGMFWLGFTCLDIARL